MKYISHIFFVLSITGCWSDKPNEREVTERISKRAQTEISRNTEKLLLLANIEEIEFEKVEIIMTEYLKATLTRKSKPKSKEDFADLIKFISEQVNLNQKKVSSIIFAYKFEMRTNIEIGEKYLKDLENANEDIYDPSDNVR